MTESGEVFNDEVAQINADLNRVQARILALIDTSPHPWEPIWKDDAKKLLGERFEKITAQIDTIADPSVSHEQWLANKNYRRGFDDYGERARENSPFIPGWWSDHWRAGWDYAHYLAQTKNLPT